MTRQAKLKQVRMELARDEDHPAGNPQEGYTFVAPLDDDGHISPEGWKAMRERCRVVHFAPDEEEIGHLVRKPGGSWAFHYDIMGDEDDDESGYRFGDHRFVPGEYVSIRDNDEDELKTYKVITVTELPDQG